MTLLLLLLLTLASYFLLFFHYRKTSLIFFIVTLCYFFVISSGCVAFLLTEHLQSAFKFEQPKWGTHNAIILLSGGTTQPSWMDRAKPAITTYSRINKAASLYSSCRKVAQECKIIISGGIPSGAHFSEAATYQNQLIDLGINPSDIILESASKNTRQNAQYTSDILKSQSFDRVFLVTSALHLKRALFHFSHFGISAIPEPADIFSPKFSLIPRAYNFFITDTALHEYLGMIKSLLPQVGEGGRDEEL